VLAEQIAGGQTGIVGVMLESHLVSGKQEYRPGGDNVYGQSITDGCIDMEETSRVLERLAKAVERRRPRR
jgi:3-deoxy-7-phosphoheptulonate synthase